MMTIHVDLHLHTRASHDGWTSVPELLRRARRHDLARIAVTDHGDICAALLAQRLDPERVIVGQEITCACGTELVGLFLRERVPMGRPIDEVAARIRDQGGVVYAPHPFAYPTRSAWRAARAVEQADVVEVFNARAFLPTWNRRASELALPPGVARAAGSDAHFPWEVGRAFTRMPIFDDADSFRRALARAEPVGVRTTSAGMHGASLGLHLARRAGGLLRRSGA